MVIDGGILAVLREEGGHCHLYDITRSKPFFMYLHFLNVQFSKILMGNWGNFTFPLLFFRITFTGFLLFLYFSFSITFLALLFLQYIPSLIHFCNLEANKLRQTNQFYKKT
jgi:hypothetical protein